MTEIEEIRKRLKLTQEEFGTHMGVTQATVSRWETRELTFTKRDILAARALDLELGSAEAA